MIKIIQEMGNGPTESLYEFSGFETSCPGMKAREDIRHSHSLLRIRFFR